MESSRIELKMHRADIPHKHLVTIHAATKLQQERKALVPPTIIVLESRVVRDVPGEEEVLIEVDYRELSDGHEYLRLTLDPETEKALKLSEGRHGDTRLDPAQRHKRRDVSDPTGQRLLGHVRSTRGPDAGRDEDDPNEW